MKYLTNVNGQSYEIEILDDSRVIVNGTERQVDLKQISNALFSVLIDQQSVEALVEHGDEHYQVLMNGDLYEIQVLDERQQRLMRSSTGFAVTQGEILVRSPMPGLIVEVRVAEGQAVEKGAALVVLESMKMENEVKAPRAGKVERIHVIRGESVEQNRPLITLA